MPKAGDYARRGAAVNHSRFPRFRLRLPACSSSPPPSSSPSWPPGSHGAFTAPPARTSTTAPRCYAGGFASHGFDGPCPRTHVATLDIVARWTGMHAAQRASVPGASCRSAHTDASPRARMMSRNDFAVASDSTFEASNVGMPMGAT